MLKIRKQASISTILGHYVINIEFLLSAYDLAMKRLHVFN